MKILITGSKEYPMGTNKKEDPISSGGIEIYIENLLRVLSKNKDLELIVLTRKFKGCDSFEKKDNITIYRVPYVNGFFTRNPTFNLFAAIKSLKLDYDIILSNDIISSLFELFVAKIRRKPIVILSHGDASEQPQYNPILRYILGLMNKVTYSFSDMNITHAPHQVKKYTNNYTMIRPGLDFSSFERVSSSEVDKLKKELGVSGKKVIMYTGRMIDVKGVKYLISALSRFDNSYTCVFVGDGPHLEKYKSLCSSVKMKCVFTGFRKDVNRFLSIADVFVAPSISESLNYSMVEAAYMKVPIIVTDIKILPGDCGRLVPVRDSGAIVDAICSVFENTVATDKMVLNAYGFSRKFDWAVAGAEYVKVFDKLIN